MVLKDDMPVYLYIAGMFLSCPAYKNLICLGVVTDTGPGLTAKELDMLFQRFSQVSRKCTTPGISLGTDGMIAKTHTIFGGSGLGLFVCRSEFIRAMN
jgi:signal transduction histidine kinase